MTALSQELDLAHQTWIERPMVLEFEVFVVLCVIKCHL